MFVSVALAALLVAVPASIGAAVPDPAQPAGPVPVTVNVSVYIMDFNRFDVGAGSVGVDFYLSLKSDSPVSISDLELMNGQVTSVTTARDTPLDKEYRVIAVLVSEPDLSRYPFDRHTLVIKLEPKSRNMQEMILSIDTTTSGIYREADLPGWAFTGTGSSVVNETYLGGEIPYSRAVFTYGIARDSTSTVLKFFLPLMLIIIVSLSSLAMRVSSRLGLNASMFLAAVLIHWRIADAIPLVPYATFLDLFMIITYATLVAVLISGILILRFSESGDAARADRTYTLSARIIPPACIALFCLLFLSLVL